MAELTNTFSWSFSAHNDFEECRRRRYWAKYAMWNGWSNNATPEQRTAYRLAKMENRFSIQGNAVEQSVMWLLEEARAGRAIDPETAYTQVARPYLNRCWSESRKGAWKGDPKRYCCLHEHYYPAHHRVATAEMTERMIAAIRTCIANFTNLLLPQLAQTPPASILAINTVATSGDPEFFMFDQVKVYAIPDYAYYSDALLNIHDWKSGAPRASHMFQVKVYGLWAHYKHKQPHKQTRVHLEYLAGGKTTSKLIYPKDIEETTYMIRQSVNNMAEYLVDGNIERNQPLPCEDWEMTADTNHCLRCNFYELCHKEQGTI